MIDFYKININNKIEKKDRIRMKKIKSAQEAISFIKEGSTVMVGGFLECGAPDILVDELVNQNIGNLTMISNDTTYPHADKVKLIVN